MEYGQSVWADSMRYGYSGGNRLLLRAGHSTWDVLEFRCLHRGHNHMVMKRTETHRGRFYSADGKKYPSVTTILSCINKPALVYWAAKVEREMVLYEAAKFYEELALPPQPVEISRLGFITQLEQRIGKEQAAKKALEKAGDIGSDAHKRIEWLLRGELCQKVGYEPPIRPEAQIAVDAWQKWRKTVDFKPVAVESQVWSHVHGFAGTQDFMAAEVNGVETLCDWKTGKAVYFEAHLQNAAYRVAVREMGLADPKAGLILRLPKTLTEPGFEAVPAWDEQECFEVFLACKKLWSYMQETDKWLKAQDEKMGDLLKESIARASFPGI